MNNRKKGIIVISLSILLLVMAVGYATVQSMLYISGTATLEQTWNVAITNISSTPTGEAYNKSTPSYTGTTATFDVGLKQPGDEMNYQITITNNGTTDAFVYRVTSGFVSSNSETVDNLVFDNVSVLSYGIKPGQVIKGGESAVLNVKVRQDNYELMHSNSDEMAYTISSTVSLLQQSNGQTRKTYVENHGYEGDWINKPVMLDDNNIYRVLAVLGDSVRLIKEEPLTLTNTPDLFNDNTYLEKGKLIEYLNSTYKNTFPEDTREKITEITVPKYSIDVAPGDDNIGGFLLSLYNACNGRGSGNLDATTSNGTASCNINYLTSFTLIKDSYHKASTFNLSNIYLNISNNTQEITLQNPLFTSSLSIAEPGGINYYANTFYEIDKNKSIEENEKYLLLEGTASAGHITSQKFSDVFNENDIKVYPVITVDMTAIK